jgi:hypothetical protein
MLDQNESAPFVRQLGAPARLSIKVRANFFAAIAVS